MPAAPRDRGRSGGRGGDVLTQGELCRGVETCDVGAVRDPRNAADELADGEVRDVARGERDGGVVRDDRERRGGTRGRRDDEVTLDLDVGGGSDGIKSDGRAAEEVGRAAGARAPNRVSERGEVDGELGDIGGEGRSPVRSPDSPLASTEAQGSAEGAGALEAAVIILEGKIGGRRQGIAVIGDERTAREARGPGIGIGLITQDPPGAVAAARDTQLAEQIGGVGQQEVEAVIAGAVPSKGQGARADETVPEGDRARVREDDGRVIVVTALSVVAVTTVGFDAGVAEEREETVGAHAGGLRRLVDIDRAVVISRRRRAGVKEAAAAQEDERARVRARVRPVARTDAARLTDISEGGDRERASDDGSTGVGIETGERLNAAARLDDGQLARTVGENGRKHGRARTIVSAAELNRLAADGEVGNRARAVGECGDEGRNRNGPGVWRSQGARRAEFEGGSWTQGVDRGRGGSAEQAGRPTRDAERTFVERDRAGEGIATRQDQEAGAGLGDTARTVSEDRRNRQRVRVRRAARDQEEFLAGARSRDGGTRDRRSAKGIVMQDTTEYGRGGRRQSERTGEGEIGGSAGESDGIGGDAASRAERGREKVVRRGAAGESHQGRGAAQGGDVGVGRRRSSHEIDHSGRREEVGTGKDAIGDGGRNRGELEVRTGRRLEAQRGARGARCVGSEIERGGATVGGHAQDAEASRGRQRADGLGERAARDGALVLEDTAGKARALDGVGTEGERAGVRDDVGAVTRRSIRTELERAARDRDVAGEVCDCPEGQRRRRRDAASNGDGIINSDRGAANAGDNGVRGDAGARDRHSRDDAGGTAHHEAVGVPGTTAGDRDAGGRRAGVVGRSRSVEPRRHPDLDQ